MLKKAFDLEYKSQDSEGLDGGEIVAYASTFDRVPDSYGDIVAPGAFAKSLAEWKESGHPIPLLFGHRTDDPRMNLGAVVDAEEDSRGLKIRAKFDETSDVAQYTRKLVMEGRLTKLSFAYDTLDSEQVTLEDGSRANELRELKLYEVSLVPIPANDLTEVIEAKAAEMTEQNAPEDEPDKQEQQGEQDEKADVAGELRDMLAAIQAVADRIAEMLEDVLDELALILYPDDASADDEGTPADGEKAEGDAIRDDNAEDPDEDNAEVGEKAAEVLAKIAKYI